MDNDKTFLTILIIIGTVFLFIIMLSFSQQNIILEILIVISFIILFILAGGHFITTNTSISDLFGTTTNIDVTVDPNNDLNTNDVTSGTGSTSEPATNNKVYHINGKYTYSEAQEICNQNKAVLANIQQINDAYADGQEWCDYGWSDDVMALYPTQYNTWENLKKNGQEKACGRPGVNGGYTNNENIKMGANCYGPTTN